MADYWNKFIDNKALLQNINVLTIVNKFVVFYQYLTSTHL